MATSPAEDDLAIRNLVARYADAVARRDRDAWAATWAEDGVWVMFGRPTEGREAAAALWESLLAGLPFVVQVPEFGLVEIDGDAGTGRWYVSERGKGLDGAGMLMLGVYHDVYRREPGSPGGWCFARRRFDPLYMGPPDLSAPAHPFPNLGAAGQGSSES